MNLKTVITAYDINDSASLSPKEVPIALALGSEGVKADPVERKDEFGVDVALESTASNINGSGVSSTIDKDVTLSAELLNLNVTKYSKQVVTQFSIMGVEEAPMDGKEYVRKDGEWTEIEELKAELVSVSAIEGLTSTNVQSALAEIFGKIGSSDPITQAQYNAITTKENRLYFINEDDELVKIYYCTTLIARKAEEDESLSNVFPLTFPFVFG